MKILTIATLALGLGAAPLLAGGHASGDAAAGEKVFSKCKACHSIMDASGEAIVKGGRNGPNLYGLYTRVAGSDEDFAKKYGKSLVKAGEEGLVWDEAQFVSYVADPRSFLRKTLGDKKAKSKMSFRLKDEEDAANVWAYLVSVGPDAN